MSAPTYVEGLALIEHPISSALFAATRDRGYRAVTIEELRGRAQITREQFDACFADKTDLVVKVFRAFTDDFKERAGRAFDAVPGWPDNMRAAAYETARWMTDNPEAVWFGMIGALEAPDGVLLLREETFKWAAGVIDAGRAAAPDPEGVPAAAPLIAVGAIAETLRRQQQGLILDDFVSAVPKMMAAAVLPYLGQDAAIRELSIHPPADLR
jgi:AcrR family transcriptional regulator